MSVVGAVWRVVPFFFKQWGEWVHAVFRLEYPTNKPFVFPDGALVMRAGKRKAGRLLDGREWNEVPETTPPPERGEEKRSDK